MFPAGHATLIKAQMKMPDAQIEQIRFLGKKLWNAGLPLIDDLHNESYGWELPKNIQASTKNIQQFKTGNYIKALKSLKPGITIIIMHCTAPSEIFYKIRN